MARMNFEELERLSTQTTEQITKSSDNWLEFVKSASNLYRYPFRDQLLIYAQRPDAQQCATMNFWNKNLNCYVNKGAKGIALFDDSARGNKIRYVFDMSDVHKVNEKSVMPVQWQVTDEVKDDILANLERIYGSTDASLSFGDRLIEISDKIALESMQSFSECIEEASAGSSLAGVIEEEKEQLLQDTLSAAISSMLLTRCGEDPTDYADKLTGLQYIDMFNTVESIVALGDTTSTLTKPILIDIEKSVITYNRTNEVKKEIERSKDNGDQVHSERRLSGAELSNRESERGEATLEIRSNEGKVSERTESVEVFSSNDERGASETLAGDRRGSIADESRATGERVSADQDRGLHGETETNGDDRDGNRQSDNGRNDLRVVISPYAPKMAKSDPNKVYIKTGKNKSLEDAMNEAREYSPVEISINHELLDYPGLERLKAENELLGISTKPLIQIGMGDKSENIEIVPEPENYEQLSLFPLMEEQIDDIEEDFEEEATKSTIDRDEIEKALRKDATIHLSAPKLSEDATNTLPIADANTIDLTNLRIAWEEFDDMEGSYLLYADTEHDKGVWLKAFETIDAAIDYIENNNMQVAFIEPSELEKEALRKNPYQEKNFKIDPLDVNGNSFAVRSDSERFGKNEIVFQGSSYDECLKYISDKVNVPEPKYYVIKDLVQLGNTAYYEKITGKKGEISRPEYFDTVEEAIAKFNEYKGMDYLKEDIPGINDESEPARRLVLGVSANIPGRDKYSKGELDILHTQGEKTLLISDAIGLKEDGYDGFMIMDSFIRDLNKIVESVEIDEYSYFETRKITDLVDQILHDNEHFPEIATEEDALDEAQHQVKLHPYLLNQSQHKTIPMTEFNAPFIKRGMEPTTVEKVENIINKSFSERIRDISLEAGKDISFSTPDFRSTIDIFWHEPSINVNYYPIVQIEMVNENGYKIGEIHEEGGENPYSWDDFMSRVAERYEEYQNKSQSVNLVVGDEIKLPEQKMISSRTGKMETLPAEYATVTEIDDEFIHLKGEKGSIQFIKPESLKDYQFIGHDKSFDEQREIKENRYKIYQLREDIDNRHNIAYESLEYLKEHNIQLNHEDFELKYNAHLDLAFHLENAQEFKPYEYLEDIFEKFNIDHPIDFTGHSLSVGDIVTLTIEGEEKAYYCDRVGFVEYPEFFKEKEIIPEIPLPNVKVEWSESKYFEGGKVYSVAEFDKIMRENDYGHKDMEIAMLERYGSYDAWSNSGDHTQYLGYDKVKFTINYTDGTTQTERQDIGDGIGGLLEFAEAFRNKDHFNELKEAAGREVDKKPYALVINKSLGGDYSHRGNWLNEEHALYSGKDFMRSHYGFGVFDLDTKKLIYKQGEFNELDAVRSNILGAAFRDDFLAKLEEKEANKSIIDQFKALKVGDTLVDKDNVLWTVSYANGFILSLDKSEDNIADSISVAKTYTGYTRNSEDIIKQNGYRVISVDEYLTENSIDAEAYHELKRKHNKELSDSVIEKSDVKKIDKLKELTDTKGYWDKVRDLTKKVTSDHSIKRWQCLADIRFHQLEALESFKHKSEPEVVEEASVSTEKPKDIVTFYVAESSEFHSFGEFHDDITDLQEAIKIFDRLSAEKGASIPALGIKLHTEGTSELEDQEHDFLTPGRLNLEGLKYLPKMAANKEVNDALHMLYATYPNCDIDGVFPDNTISDNTKDKIFVVSEEKITDEITYRWLVTDYDFEHRSLSQRTDPKMALDFGTIENAQRFIDQLDGSDIMGVDAKDFYYATDKQVEQMIAEGKFEHKAMHMKVIDPSIGYIPFDSGEEMLDFIQKGNDLYFPETETYVFAYNESGSICVCSPVDKEAALKLNNQNRDEGGLYWGASLNGNIYDDPSYEGFDSNSESNLDWCNKAFNEKGIYVTNYINDLEDRIDKILNDTPLSNEIIEDKVDNEIVNKDKEIGLKMPEKVSNYHITDYDLGKGGAKEKFRRNADAIRTLKKIEEENRPATKEEQNILSQYIGWGGLADAFDDSKPSWRAEYNELKDLLTDKEYESARSSTLEAFYTSPTIIEGIYDTLGRMGFESGNILEPSCGVGNFFGMVPDKMRDSKLYGVELDSISGRIAKQLYPDAKITISGYEQVGFKDNTFDVAVGNVPFGNHKPFDKDYTKQNFLIHDYFFAKTLDKVRPGGVIAFVTSKGTMDKEDSKVRKYIAERAELLGAIRLPNTAFKENAGTEVTSDILFLKKRENIVDIEPDWVNIGINDAGIKMNQYFVDHPECIVGKMDMVSTRFGMDTACLPDTEKPFDIQLKTALSNINGTYEPAKQKENSIENTMPSSDIDATPDVRNYSYTVVDNKLYYREDSVLKLQENFKGDKEARIRGLIEIRDKAKELLDIQLTDATEEEIAEIRDELNELYDEYVKDYGLVTDKKNKSAFAEDYSCSLIQSLEIKDEKTEKYRKSDIFTKRTVKKAIVLDRVDSASEALTISLNEKGKIDLPYMATLCNKPEDTIINELQGVIFKNPVTNRFETSDEYLSGNVRNKLAVAQSFAKDNPEFNINVSALESVQPIDLSAADIEVRLGSAWIDKKYIDQFMRETFEPPYYRNNSIRVTYNNLTDRWYIEGKTLDYGNVKVEKTWGTDRRNAYQILEDCLNLKPSEVYNTIEVNGIQKREIDKEATMVAQQKQDALKEEFKNWIFKDPDRRNDIVKTYNEQFNSIRPRTFDGSHIELPGSNPNVELKPHQKDGIARILYGDNTLLAHCVGAGKTWTMAAGAMESKRLGLCNKSLFVVPNALTEQWGNDFRQLYPNANILVATSKDFEPKNRKKFLCKIATGNYDAVIVGFSQFEKMRPSKEYQELFINNQIEEAEKARLELDPSEDRHSIKEIENLKKKLREKLEKILNAKTKDEEITFEQLGIDRLFIDEAHYYKNLDTPTKMSRIPGVQSSGSIKSMDMLLKCRYIDEITNGKGLTFATGTPIANSMTELYTNMRYLQREKLEALKLNTFDRWASAFGETTTAMEVSVEGNKYNAKTRFNKFFNVPELMNIFKESADIRTPDMLDLPVPDVKYEDVILEKSDIQAEFLEEIGERADRIRNGGVNQTVDNMLKITLDGRKLALDQRILDPNLPDNHNSKASACVEKAFEIYQDTMEQKSTQLIFCDLSTPKGNGEFSVYDDIKSKLIAKGVPEEEIAFIHDVGTDKDGSKKEKLFADVNAGRVRFLIGSTNKMGAGMNVQKRLIALHHVDVPWRPADIEQQEGRILRRGNDNEQVKIFRYITKGTFDQYNWQLLENKQKSISQIMTSKASVRSCDDVDDATLKYAEVKALCSDNPLIAKKMTLDNEVTKLRALKSAYTKNLYELQDNIAIHYPAEISRFKASITALKADIVTYNAHKPADKDNFSMTIGNKVYTDKKEAGEVLLATVKASLIKDDKLICEDTKVGSYNGFELYANYDMFNREFYISIMGDYKYKTSLGNDAIGNIIRLNNTLDGISEMLGNFENLLVRKEKALEDAKIEVAKPFTKDKELKDKLDELSKVNAELKLDEKDPKVILGDEETEKETVSCEADEPELSEDKEEEISNDDKINVKEMIAKNKESIESKSSEQKPTIQNKIDKSAR